MHLPEFDPALPAPNSLICSEELRNQFNALKRLVDAQQAQFETFRDSFRAAVGQVAPLAQGISDPPTQAEVAALQTTLNQLVELLRGS